MLRYIVRKDMFWLLGLLGKVWPNFIPTASVNRCDEATYRSSKNEPVCPNGQNLDIFGAEAEVRRR